MATFANGLRIYDISSPKAPAFVGSYSTGLNNAVSLAVAGNYAYVGDENDGVYILDVSNPTAPTQVGLYSSVITPYSIAVSGKYVYAPDFTNGKLHFEFRLFTGHSCH